MARYRPVTLTSQNAKDITITVCISGRSNRQHAVSGSGGAREDEICKGYFDDSRTEGKVDGSIQVVRPAVAVDDGKAVRVGCVFLETQVGDKAIKVFAGEINARRAAIQHDPGPPARYGCLISFDLPRPAVPNLCEVDPVSAET